MKHKRVFSQTFGVVGAILEKDGKFLLVKEAKGKVDRGKWSHPAGWIDVGEDPIDSVKREVKEETGFDFTPSAVLGVYSLVRRDIADQLQAVPHAIKIIFFGEIGKQAGTLADDVSETKWFTPEEIYVMDLNLLRDIDIKQMVKDYISGKRFSLNILSHTISE